ncbi:MAG: 7-carboxy-7-deazaguanine synthase QueE [Endomicrobium sp.]|jgi:organic radical activating enzyme|nr:7-carboxy-7-deazaguanine synthase QueE [Endomicrobium sp.]
MIPSLRNIKAPIYDIFFSFQGEALYTGLPQIFIRFAGCNLKCNYCDTLYSTIISKKAKYLTCNRILNKVIFLYTKNKEKFTEVFVETFTKNLSTRKPSISITGGEPLLHTDFLEVLLPKLKEIGFRIYLETNGTMPNNLIKIIKFCDIISIDFKFKSECGNSFWKEHKKFLEIALSNSKSETFVKNVLTKNTNILEIKKSAKLIKSISDKISLILQPSINKNSPAIQNLYKFYNVAKKIIPNVHLMVQMHKIYKVK